MRALALVVVLAGASLLAAGPAGAKRSPRLEKLAPVAADGAKAKDAVVRISDLVSGWKGGPSTADKNAAPDCSWQNYSAYTITGESEADYSASTGEIISLVQVFPDSAQALGDFQVDTRPGTAACQGEAFKRAFGKGAKLLSAKEVSAPGIGDHDVAYRFTVQLDGHDFYSDVIEFVRDRSIGGVVTINAGQPLVGNQTLARLMDARLQPEPVA